MNGPIVRVFGVTLVLFALLIAFTSRWAVFEYTQGQWRLLRTSVGGQVNPPGLPNLLRLMRLDANTVRLAINDFQVYDVDNVAGRVGLSAGSLEPAAEARFDDYMFVGNGCLVPEARTRPDRGPITLRPPIETPPRDKLQTTNDELRMKRLANLALPDSSLVTRRSSLVTRHS